MTVSSINGYSPFVVFLYAVLSFSSSYGLILHKNCYFSLLLGLWWLDSRVVSMLDSGAEGPGFICLRQTVHTIMPLFTKQHNW